MTGLALALLAAFGQWIASADWPNPAATSLPPKADLILVLGGGGEERVRLTTKLYQEGRAPKILITGDGGLIIGGLRKAGIPETALIHETAATSTIENARNTAPILQQLSAHSVILVTTWFHAQRAQRTFERELPGITFSPAFEPRTLPLSPFDAGDQRRERVAAFYYLLRHGIWCF
jgi:uncharacterized SAM-binding protein YcdF (DUF218 family)